MKPKIIVINGYPQSGKDTFCEFAHERYRCVTYSTVDTVKELATDMGWDGTKTPENRAMLSALKDFTTEWFDMTYHEMIDLINYEIESNKDYETDPKNTTKFIFLHIREPKDIKRMAEWCAESAIECYLVCIEREEIKDQEQSNHADKNIDFISYDDYISNNGTLEEFKEQTFNYLAFLEADISLNQSEEMI